MSALIFVDTNVLVYVRDSTELQKQRMAARWMEELWKEQSGRTSVQVLTEYYVTVTRKLKPGLKPEQAWDDVLALSTWDPQVSDRELLVAAREIERRFRIGWWDSMIVAAAQMQSCSVLLSEDLQDGMEFGRVTVRNPFSFSIGEAKTEYAVKPLARMRHRARGRPARTVA